VDEVLRFESPLHITTMRFTTEPVAIAGVRIPANQFVHISLPASNRDARRFPRPDHFDVTRDPRGHLAFGHGIHFCVGAPLARLEGEIALRKLLDRFSVLTPDPEAPAPRWRPSLLIHGLQNLPITYVR
jgi:cytochrome P450